MGAGRRNYNVDDANITSNGDFLGGPVGKTLCSQCSGPGFGLWSGS